ncbi:MAG: fatty acid--CoA ligase [Archaeoglobales archaeon]|nr:fatty acid--CoA ligase [Archaeoglobales archaeon]
MFIKGCDVYEYQLLLKHILNSGVNYAPNQEIVYRDLYRYTYRDLYERVCKLANALEELGVKNGTRIGVMEWDSHRYLECYFAIPMLGAVLHTINVRLSAETVAYTINHAEDEIILVNTDFLPLLDLIRKRLSVKRFILIKDSEKSLETDLTELEYEEMLRNSKSNYDFPEFDENTVATLFYTTGTTGDPKGVWFTHRQLVLHTLAAAVWVTGWRSNVRLKEEKEVYMPLTPMFHVHAWGYPYVATLLGLKQVYPGRYEPKKIVELILKEKVTFSHCVPTILQMIIENLPAGIILDKWKVIVGGSKLPEGLAIKAKERGIKVTSGYGMSETCPKLLSAAFKPHLTDLSDDEKLKYCLKTGIPNPLVYVRVVNENFTDVKKNGKEMGEIIVRAPWLTQGYLKDEIKTKELWAGGWLHTGDIAVVDEEGYVTIVDRLKDVIKSGGEWISSLALENLLSMHPKVKEVAVIGKPHEKWGERPVAIIVPIENEKPSEEELRSFLMKLVEEGRITKWAIPDDFVIVDQIPKTSVGKIDKKMLRKMFSKQFYSKVVNKKSYDTS